MNESVDLRSLLEGWPYDPNNTARLARGQDGRPILLVRLPLGIEQHELDGRPDGQRPHGCDSLFDFHLHRLAGAKARGEADEFSLTAAECAGLFEEGTLFYCRYLQFFQLKDWRRTARDTGRNLRLFDFIHAHAARQQDRVYLEQWRPYVLRMNAAAQAMVHLQRHEFAEALGATLRAIEGIEALPEVPGEVFELERERALEALRDLAAQIEQNRPASPLQRLEQALQQAIDDQAFEQAARLRDEIRVLRARESTEGRD